MVIFLFIYLFTYEMLCLMMSTLKKELFMDILKNKRSEKFNSMSVVENIRL